MFRIQNRLVPALMFLAILLSGSAAVHAQEEGPAIDVTHYKIDAELVPDSHTLKARAAVSFKPLKQTQSAVFEMNGSLSISAVTAPDGKTALQFKIGRASCRE